MTEYTNAQLYAAHVHCSAHRSAIEQSAECGCFSCCRIFPASHVIHWVKGIDCEDSAHCPNCGIDSVIADASGLPITNEFLLAMNEKYFTKSSQLGTASEIPFNQEVLAALNEKYESDDNGDTRAIKVITARYEQLCAESEKKVSS